MDKFACAVFDELGGPTKVARFFEVSRVAVYAWKRDGFPKARMMWLTSAPKARHIVKKARARLAAQEEQNSIQETAES